MMPVWAPEPPPPNRRAGETALVCLHPVALDGDYFGNLGIAGAVAPVMPGHGSRRRPRPGLTLEDMADEIVGWSAAPFDLLGASMGGMVALQLALNYPGHVRSLVLACTAARADRALMTRRAEITSTRGSAAMAEETIQRWFSPDFLSSPANDAALRYARERLANMDTESLADIWRAVGRHDVLDRLSEIAVPVTCIGGRYDRSLPCEMMEEIAARLPRSRMVVLDTGHMANLEQPEKFREAVRNHREWIETQIPA